MVQQVVMKKETKSHSMVKDNLELPSLMSLEDSPFKEELFRKMGESKMNKDEIITLINRNKIVKFVSILSVSCLNVWSSNTPFNI
jgi:hypothetical protein